MFKFLLFTCSFGMQNLEPLDLISKDPVSFFEQMIQVLPSQIRAHKSQMEKEDHFSVSLRHRMVKSRLFLMESQKDIINRAFYTFGKNLRFDNISFLTIKKKIQDHSGSSQDSISWEEYENWFFPSCFCNILNEYILKVSSGVAGELKGKWSKTASDLPETTNAFLKKTKNKIKQEYLNVYDILYKMCHQNVFNTHAGTSPVFFITSDCFNKKDERDEVEEKAHYIHSIVKYRWLKEKTEALIKLIKIPFYDGLTISLSEQLVTNFHQHVQSYYMTDYVKELAPYLGEQRSILQKTGPDPEKLVQIGQGILDSAVQLRQHLESRLFQKTSKKSVFSKITPGVPGAKDNRSIDDLLKFIGAEKSSKQASQSSKKQKAKQPSVSEAKEIKPAEEVKKQEVINDIDLLPPEQTVKEVNDGKWLEVGKKSHKSPEERGKKKKKNKEPHLNAPSSNVKPAPAIKTVPAKPTVQNPVVKGQDQKPAPVPSVTKQGTPLSYANAAAIVKSAPEKNVVQPEFQTKVVPVVQTSSSQGVKKVQQPSKKNKAPSVKQQEKLVVSPKGSGDEQEKSKKAPLSHQAQGKNNSLVAEPQTKHVTVAELESQLKQQLGVSSPQEAVHHFYPVFVQPMHPHFFPEEGCTLAIAQENFRIFNDQLVKFNPQNLLSPQEVLDFGRVQQITHYWAWQIVRLGGQLPL